MGSRSNGADARPLSVCTAWAAFGLEQSDVGRLNRAFEEESFPRCVHIDHGHRSPSFSARTIQGPSRDRDPVLLALKIIRVEVDHVIFPGLHHDPPRHPSPSSRAPGHRAARAYR